MQFGHAFVIAAQKGHKIIRQIMLIIITQAAHDTEIHQRDAHRFVRLWDDDKDIAGMHISMKIAITKNLGEKQFYPCLGNFLSADTGSFQLIDFINTNTANTFHDQDIFSRQIPVYFRNNELFGILEITFKLGCIGGLAHQIKFIEDDFSIFLYHSCWS